MAELDKKRRGELLRAVFDVLANHPDGIQAKDALAAVEANIELTGYEKSNYPGTETRRFEKTVRFQTINAVKAGWMVKDRGIWTATESGLAAHESITDPEQFMETAGQLYQAWVKDQPDEPVTDLDRDVSLTVEKAEETAWQEVRDHLLAMDPYDFQELVAGLLRGMGYDVAYVAPPGKDQGVDIVAQTDPLGAAGPRVKVQVKREKAKTDAKSLRAFTSVLKAGDVGLFVTTGGFTADAEREARADTRRVTLLDSNRLFDLWVRNYDRIPEEDRSRLPIKLIPFLRPDASSRS